MESRFDTLAKLLASGMSRREALRQLSGTAAGVVLAALGLGCRDDVVGPQRLTDSDLGPLFKKSPTKKECKEFCKDAVLHDPGNTLRNRCEDVCELCGGDLTRVCGDICCPPDMICNPIFGGCCRPGGPGAECNTGACCLSGSCTDRVCL
jgi:hypothetical protein